MDSDDDSEIQATAKSTRRPHRSKREKRITPSSEVPAKRPRGAKQKSPNTSTAYDEEMRDEVFVNNYN